MYINPINHISEIWKASPEASVYFPKAAYMLQFWFYSPASAFPICIMYLYIRFECLKASFQVFPHVLTHAPPSNTAIINTIYRFNTNS